MRQTETDKKLLAYQQSKHRSIAKLLSHLKRHFDAWAVDEFAAAGYGDFKMGYMPLIMNIHPEGITNNELAKKAKVSKLVPARQWRHTSVLFMLMKTLCWPICDFQTAYKVHLDFPLQC